MTRILQSSWFISLTGCLIYLAVTVALLPPSKFAGAQFARDEVMRSADDDPSWRFKNPEFDQWVNELKQERDSLAQREQQVKELEARLESEQQEMQAVTQSVAQLQADFDRNVIRIKDQEVQNLKREVRVLTEMPPESAATMVSQMTDTDAVRVLCLMKPDQIAAILEALTQKGQMPAKRAADLTEQMRRTLPPDTSARNTSSY